MAIASFLPLQSLLTQLSAASVEVQEGFVEKANAHLEGRLQEPDLADIHVAARHLLMPNGSPPAPSPKAIRWMRWKDPYGNSGLSLLFIAARTRYVLLPDRPAPRFITFERPLLPGRLFLLAPQIKPNPADEVALVYAHRDALQVFPRPEDDERNYARLLRMIERGLSPPLPSFLTEPERPIAHWIDECHGGVHSSILAFQKGMEFVLGELAPGWIPHHTIPLATAAAVYPHYEVVLSEGPDLQDRLDDDACFGTGDPFYKRLQIEVSGQRLFKNDDGTAVGWSHLVAGGREGHHADPISGLSAATSMGGRTNQEDGFYVAHFRDHDGHDVRVMAGADGLGGNEMGELASSAALQGIHAGIVHALRHHRLPLAADLFETARSALEAQILFEEMESGTSFRRERGPDTVLAVSVIVDGSATIATSGDFMTVLCSLGEDHRVHVLGHTSVDSMNDYIVSRTLRMGHPRLFGARMAPDSWLVAASDGAMEGLAANFKRHTAREYREELMGSFPEESLFYNLLHVLEHAPPHYAGLALHDAASGSLVIPGIAADPAAEAPSYPDLGPVLPEEDNWTVVAQHWRTPLEETPYEIPTAYGPLEGIYPTHQYVFNKGPYEVYLPSVFPELFVGGACHPEGRPTVVMQEGEDLAPLHARLERVSKAGVDRFFLEKLTGRGRIIIFDETDRRIVSLVRKGARHGIKAGHLVRLNQHHFFRFRGIV